MSRRARTYGQAQEAKWISLLPLGHDAEVESDSDMCECDFPPTKEELRVGRCSMCEGWIYPQWGNE